MAAFWHELFKKCDGIFLTKHNLDHCYWFCLATKPNCSNWKFTCKPVSSMVGLFLCTARSPNWQALKRKMLYRPCNTWISSTIIKDSTSWQSPKKRWMCTQKLQQKELSALIPSAFTGSLKTGASGGNGETVCLCVKLMLGSSVGFPTHVQLYKILHSGWQQMKWPERSLRVIVSVIFSGSFIISYCSTKPWLLHAIV